MTPLIIMVIVLERSYQQILLYSAFTNPTISNVESWKILTSESSPYITNCNGVDIVGGYDKLGQDSVATFFSDLPPHYRIRISIDIYIIDSWNGEQLQIYVDHQQTYQKTFSWLLATTYLCGDIWKDDKETIQFEMDHNFRNVYILITNTLNHSLSDSFEDCQIWNQAKSLQTKLDLGDFQVDGWTNTGGGVTKDDCLQIPLIFGPQKCRLNTLIKTKFFLPEHYQIKIQFKYIKIDNWDVGDKAILNIVGETLWTQEFNALTQYTNSLCGGNIKDSIVNSVTTLLHSYYEINIELSNNLIDSFSTQSFGFRDFEIFTSMNKLQSSPGTPIICGDKLIQGSEFCDVGNLEPFDGCFSCQFSCSDGCLDYLFGTCINCHPDWLQDFDNNVTITIYNHLMDVLIINILVFMDVKNLQKEYVYFLKKVLNLIVLLMVVNLFAEINKYNQLFKYLRQSNFTRKFEK